MTKKIKEEYLIDEKSEFEENEVRGGITPEGEQRLCEWITNLMFDRGYTPKTNMLRTRIVKWKNNETKDVVYPFELPHFVKTEDGMEYIDLCFPFELTDEEDKSLQSLVLV